MKLPALALFTLLFCTLSAQTDSLKKLLEKATHDTTRCTLLNQLIEAESNDAIWPGYNDQLLKIAEKNLVNPGTLKNFYLKSRSIAVNNLGYLANLAGDNKKATENYEEALSIQQKIGHKEGMAASYYNLGDIYVNRGDLSRGLEYLHKALTIYEKLKNDYGMSYVLNDLGWNYYVQGDLAKGLEYLEKALVKRIRIDDKRGQANTYNTIGLIYRRLGKEKEAEENYRKTLALMEETDDQRGVAMALNSLGILSQDRAQYREAITYFEKAATIQEKLHDLSGWTTTINNHGVCLYYLANGDRKMYEQALVYSNKSMAAAKKMGQPTHIKSAAYTLQGIYRKLGDAKKALEYYQLFITMSDSIANAETRKTSIKRQFEYEYGKKAAADSVRNQEEQKVKDALISAHNSQLKQEKVGRYALYGGLLAVVIFVIFIFNRFRITQRQKAIIEEQKKLVDMAYESLHEKNKEVMDSIFYARRIQRALITSERYVEKQLKRLQNKE